MDYRSIAKLVDKYFLGETTLEEEALLKAYFSGEDIHESLLPYQSVFQFFSKEKESAAGGDAGFERTFEDQRADPAHLFLEQAVGRRGFERLQRVRADQLGGVFGPVDRRRAHGAHFVEPDGVTATHR